VDLSAELLACLKEFTADGAIEIRENGGRVAPFSESRGKCAALRRNLSCICGPKTTI
jgi:hypothetical protein